MNEPDLFATDSRDTSSWWNIDGINREIESTAPASLLGMDFKPSQMGMKWKARYAAVFPTSPEPIQGINGTRGYSYPPDTKDTFLTWLQTDYWPWLMDRIDANKEKNAPKLPDSVTAADCVFAGKKICFTGFSGPDKETVLDLATQLGCEIKSDVTADLDYLVCGAKPEDAIIDRAIDRKICIVPLGAFIRRIRGQQ